MNKQADPLNQGRRPSPDNRGLDKENPKDVDEEAAKVNRNTDALIKQVDKSKKGNKPVR